ncbi:MAG: ABC transporter transmembrane domain-containing protein [Pseudomonadota bacterium]
MEKNVLKYVWSHSRRDQLWMLVVIIASMPTYFLSLELPKQIVNNPIQGVGFENPGDTSSFLQFSLPFGETLFGREIVLFSGFDLERISFLWALSVAFLLLVVANGLFKLYINTYKGRMGERLLRRLRYELFDHVLRYPLSRFRRTRASEIASMIKDEVEPMGEFIGDAFTQPLFLGGQALVALLFIFLQNFYLGLATMVVIGFQAWLIPVLRRRLIELGKERQIVARQLAGRLGEVVEGIQDSHTNDTTNYERSEITSTLGRLFFIRFELFQRKFSVKFLNNLLIQFLSFFFYAVGGYFAIRGTLDIGQLLGVIVAYKDLPAPVRGLIDHDQKRLNVEARYSQIIEQFTSDALQDADLQRVPDGKIPNIEKGYEINRLMVEDESGSKLIESANANIGKNERIAVLGGFGSGASAFMTVLTGVVPVSGGRLLLEGEPVEQQPEYFRGRRLAYLDSNNFFGQGSVYDSLTYVLKSQPTGTIQLEEEDLKAFQLREAERKKSDNFYLDFDQEWIDLERTGVANNEELTQKIRDILIEVKLEPEIRTFGLRGTLDPVEFPELTEKLLEARKIFRERLVELGFVEFVEPFDPQSYNTQSSVGENLLFGTAVASGFEVDNLPGNEIIRKVLDENGLEVPLFEMGKEVASTTIELFGDLDPDNSFFDQLTYMDSEDLPLYAEMLRKIDQKRVDEIRDEDRRRIMQLSFSYIEEQNRLGLLDDELKAKILSARQSLREKLTELPVNPVSFYEPDTYNPAASILDNVLLGRVSNSVAEGYERVSTAIQALLNELELTDDVFRIGLSYNIGSGGKKLSESQRQKLHLARALLKNPDILIVNQALNSLSTREQGEMIEMCLNRNSDGSETERMGIIWAPMNPAFAAKFDRILIFKDGELKEDGPAENISSQSPIYQELIS